MILRRRGPRPVSVPIGVQPPFSPALARRRRHWARVWLTRLLVVAAAGLAAAALYTLVVQPLLPERESAPPAPTPIERPETIPARVPAWAWDLHLWHLTPAAERGPRPEAAPARVPDWYWDFRRWRLSLAPPG
ncbi:MAG TPA: hypothetical protein VNT23_09835 [Gaiellaceae bacterium]|nr:hypothetical protein [Gaiellaceae bacterium]